MKASVIIGTERKIKVPFMGQVLHLVYDLGAITDELKRDIRINDQDLKGFDHAILNTVSEWDWNDDNDQPLPIDEETVAAMPMPLKQAIWTKINEDSDPKVLGSVSRTGSGRRGR